MDTNHPTEIKHSNDNNGIETEIETETAVERFKILCTDYIQSEREKSSHKK